MFASTLAQVCMGALVGCCLAHRLFEAQALTSIVSQASKLARAQVSMNVSTREYQIVHRSGGSNVSMDGKSRKTNREW